MGVMVDGARIIDGRRLALLALVALAVRVLYFVEHSGSVYFALPHLDSPYFDGLARAVAS